MLENSVMATAAMRRAFTASRSSVLGASDTDRCFSAVFTGASSGCESFGDGSDEVSDGMEASPSSEGVRREAVFLGAGEACFKNACEGQRKDAVRNSFSEKKNDATALVCCHVLDCAPHPSYRALVCEEAPPSFAQQ